MKKIIKTPLIILGIGILIMAASTAGATRAAMVYQSKAERINFSTAALSIDILEEVDGGYKSLDDGQELSFGNIVTEEGFKVGKKYPENVIVTNNSNPDTGYSEYVRVVVRKSWFLDGKNTELDPDLIKIYVAEGWYENKAEATSEQAVYYRITPLACGQSADFITGIQIDNEITTYVESKPSTDGGVEISGTIENQYLYNGHSVYIQLQADAVQTHNSEDAIYAAWGIKASCDGIDDGNITAIGGQATR